MTYFFDKSFLRRINYTKQEHLNIQKTFVWKGNKRCALTDISRLNSRQAQNGFCMMCKYLAIEGKGANLSRLVCPSNCSIKRRLCTDASSSAHDLY